MSARTKAGRPAAAPAAASAKSPADGLSFEEALGRLEGLVDRLEGGDLDLEDALAAFEEGVALTRRCAGQLEEAEQRVETLMREGDQWVARPFEDVEEAE